MSRLKTTVNDASVEAFLAGVENGKRRADTQVVLEIMARVTGHPPKMWGTSIVGFDSYHYSYQSKREGDWPITGFSPRKHALSVYVMPGFGAYGELMQKLGKYRTGKSCLYIKKLEDVDLTVLEELLRRSVADMRERYHGAAVTSS